MNNRRLLLAGALIATTGLSTACMGKFVLTKSLYSFNESVTGSKIINNLIFWALLILPVYELATLGDAVIFNVIEFWTGKNLLADGSSVDPEMRIATKNGEVFKATLIDDSTVVVRQGQFIIGTLEVIEGGLLIRDAEGIERNVVPFDELDAAMPALASLR